MDIGSKYTSFLQDESRLAGKAGGIAFPVCAAEAREALRQAAAAGKTVTVQGGRTGITGGASPAEGGLIINLSGMRAVTALSQDSSGVFYVTVEPGIRLAEFTEAISRKDFNTTGWSGDSLTAFEGFKRAPRQFFAPDPTETTATLGGMFASNAQGLCAFCYGAMADYVQGLDFMLPDGESWRVERGRYVFDGGGISLPDGRRLSADIPAERTVCRFLAPETGMDLVDFLAGSEGLLGVVTSLTLRLSRAQADHWAVMFFFSEFEQALGFSKEIAAGVCRSCRAVVEAIELFDRGSLDLVEELKTRMSKLRVIPDIPGEYKASVYVQLASDNYNDADETLSALADTFIACGGSESDTWAAACDDEIQKFKLFRHAVPEAANARIDAIRRTNPAVHKAATDFTVPMSRLDEAVAMYREGIAEGGIPGVIFGHVSIGRLHVNLFPENGKQMEKARAIIDGWAAGVISAGGRIADENGVGRLKKALVLRHVPRGQLDAAACIRKFFDRNSILSPHSGI